MALRQNYAHTFVYLSLVTRVNSSVCLIFPDINYTVESHNKNRLFISNKLNTKSKSWGPMIKLVELKQTVRGDFFFENFVFILPLSLLIANKDLTLTRPIGLPPHAPVAQKITDQR